MRNMLSPARLSMKKRIFLVTSLMIVLIGLFGVASEVKSVEAGGTIYIRADGSIDPPTAPISTDDNVTYTFTDNINDTIVVERSHITIDGAGYTLNGTGTGEPVGFTVEVSYNVTIQHVNIEGFGLGPEIPAILLNNTSYNTILANTLTNNECVIGLRNSSNNNIIGNTITNSYYCIGLFEMSSGNTISRNNLTSNAFPIVLIMSSGNTISRNTLTNTSRSGILFFWGSSNNTISGNNITETVGNSIVFSDLRPADGLVGPSHECSNNTIFGNNITKGGIGFMTYTSSNNVISGNNIAGHTQAGVRLTDFSHHNVVFGNNITDNGDGVHLWDASDNNFYHNNFIDNTNQIYVETSHGNAWDDGYPSGGNYWDDYAGSDQHRGPYQNETGSDGIGDTSHNVFAGNKDGFPLMGPFSSFSAGTWDEKTYHVHTVSNSIISDFAFSVDDKLADFNVAGPDDTDGFCRVAIPDELLWCDTPEQWTVLVNNTAVTYTAMENGDYTYIYFNYSHSTQNVQIKGIHVIPELSTWTSMLLTLIVLTVAIAIHKRRLLKTPNH